MLLLTILNLFLCTVEHPSRAAFLCVGSGLDSSAFVLVLRWEPAPIDIAGSPRRNNLIRIRSSFRFWKGSLVRSVSNSCSFQFIKTNLRFLFVSLLSPSFVWIIKLTPDCLLTFYALSIFLPIIHIWELWHLYPVLRGARVLETFVKGRVSKEVKGSPYQFCCPHTDFKVNLHSELNNILTLGISQSSALAFKRFYSIDSREIPKRCETDS